MVPTAVEETMAAAPARGAEGAKALGAGKAMTVAAVTAIIEMDRAFNIGTDAT
jgi:hypothetical protein